MFSVFSGLGKDRPDPLGRRELRPSSDRGSKAEIARGAVLPRNNKKIDTPACGHSSCQRGTCTEFSFLSFIIYTL